MTSPVERRYRHVLRLLPAGYRADWEEDMVTAYMEGAPSGRPTPGERLSVVLLAVRLRLNGSHATPRGLVGYRAVHAIALTVLLYQAVAAATSIVASISFVVRFHPSGAEILDSFFLWSPLFGLLWVAAFGSFVWSRFVAARVLVLLATASAIGVVVATVAIAGVNRSPLAVTDVTRWAWLALSVVVVFVTPSSARASRLLWVGGYAVGTAIIVVAYVRPYFVAPQPMHSSWWVHLQDVGELMSVGLAVGMVGVLATTRSAHWLVALALLAGGLSGVRLLSSLLRPWPLGRPEHVVQADLLSAALLIVAVVCAAVGLFQWRRVPAR